MIESRLVAFQLGHVAAHEREAIETHLLNCRACLEDFLAIKRGMDFAADGVQRPNADVRRALKAAFARSVTPRRVEVMRIWRPRRPLLLAAGFATAVLLGLGLWLPGYLHNGATRSRQGLTGEWMHGRTVDTASPAALNLNTL